MNSLEKFNEEKLPATKYFFSSTKKTKKTKKIDDDGKKPDNHTSFKDYLTCEKI